MDEKLRKLQREASDPQSRLRYARELLRGGADKSCVNQICEISNYFNHLVAHGSVSEQHMAVDNRQKLFEKLAGCLTPIKIYILLHQSDEGDWDPVGTFTSHLAAIRQASSIIIERLQNLFTDDWDHEGWADSELLGDLIRLYKVADYVEILGQARNMLGGMDYIVVESDLLS